MWNELAREKDGAEREAEGEDPSKPFEPEGSDTKGRGTGFVFALMVLRIALVQSFQIMLLFLPFWM